MGKTSPRQRMRGLRKYVVTEELEQTVPVQREEARLEREPDHRRQRRDHRALFDSEEEHEVVLHEEELVTEKRAVPKERVRLDQADRQRRPDDLRRGPQRADRGRGRHPRPAQTQVVAAALGSRQGRRPGGAGPAWPRLYSVPDGRRRAEPRRTVRSTGVKCAVLAVPLFAESGARRPELRRSRRLPALRGKRTLRPQLLFCGGRTSPSRLFGRPLPAAPERRDAGAPRRETSEATGGHQAFLEQPCRSRFRHGGT